MLWSARYPIFTTDLDLSVVLDLARLASRLQARDVHGMQLGDTIEDYTTPEDSMVLVLKDKALVQEKLAGVRAKTLSERQRRNLDRRMPPVAV